MNPAKFFTLRALFLWISAVAVSRAQTPVNSSIGYERENNTNRVLLTWEAVPTKFYNVLTTTALGTQSWQMVYPGAIYASNNLVRVRETNTSPARFYKVTKVDTDPPEIWRLNPGSNATAVARQGVMKIYLRDETAIDPASISLSVGTNPAVTLADARLTFTNDVLTYAPATNQFLGDHGQNITNRLIVADTLGRRSTNSWPLRLEFSPVLASSVVLVTSNSPLTLLSTNGGTWIFSYTGPSPGLTNGAILVSTDASNPYKRTVLSLTDNPAAHTVSLVTTQAALGDILLQGSVQFYGDEFSPDSALRGAAKGGVAAEIGLGGFTLYENAQVKVETTAGRLLFDPDFRMAADFLGAGTVELEVAVEMALDLTMKASWQNSWSFAPAPRPIGRPLRQFRLLGWIPTPTPIPVWAEAVWEFALGTEGEVAGQASLTAGFESSARISFGAKLRAGQWTTDSSYAPRAVGYPVAWQVGGSGRIRGYVQPKLTIYLESLFGPTAQVRPFLEVVGNACVQPGRAGVDVALYDGITGTLALDIRGWRPEWASLPSCELFNLRSVNPLWHQNLTRPVGPPPQTFGSMAWIPCGTFTMGSPDSEPARQSDEGPQTRVTISQGFWMGRFEVTQDEYLTVMGSNPSYFVATNGYGTDLSRPVEQVSWNDAVAYCAALTTRERTAGRLPAGYGYRLPTEAEWEYACRAGTTTTFHYGPALHSGMANFYGQYEYPPCAGLTYHCYNPGGIHLDRTTAVGSYAPNAWGLYDMHGNVWEWCRDWYGTYPGGSVTDPQGAPAGSGRVIRGGGWGGNAGGCRAAIRSGSYPVSWNDAGIGFRVVLAPNQ